jgi:predicted alpha/beta-hydrolase family hydrolase
VTAIDVETPAGAARAHLHEVDGPAGVLILGHGAAGGVGAADLVAVTESARGTGFSVALVEQPYIVAGRRSPAPTTRLDTAYTAVVERLRGAELRGPPLVVGGRSLGARVACRTAAGLGAVAVLCVAFPLHPPGRADDPTKSRQHELDAVEVPTLVIQGSSDPFGSPPPGPNRRVVKVPGNHAPSPDLDAVGRAAADWLENVVR